MAFKYPDPYALTQDDIEWFRNCRSRWVEAESGAPGIFAPGVEPELMDEISDDTYRDFERRMEPIQCAFFLHARFVPGQYKIRGDDGDKQSVVDVTDTDITLLQHTSWRDFMIDPKRPYGDFTDYPIEMAQALGHPVSKDDQGYARIDPGLEAELMALHQKSTQVLQAYIEHAKIAPGDWLILYNGWDAIMAPRCRPVGEQAMTRYLTEMATIKERVGAATSGDMVVPLLQASAALFTSP